MASGWRKWRWDTLIADLQANCDLHPATGCLLWRGGTDRDGYPKVSIDGTDWRGARAILKAKTGVLGEVARHFCDTPRCLNDEHLSWGTHQDNRDDAVERGRAVFNAKPMSGERNGRAKLTADQVHEIRVARTQRPRVKIRVLMTRYGVSKATIEAVQSGKSWN